MTFNDLTPPPHIQSMFIIVAIWMLALIGFLMGCITYSSPSSLLGL